MSWLPLYRVRLLLSRHLLRVPIGRGSGIHRGCRFYRPSGVQIGVCTIINRDVLLDGRMGLVIGSSVSISEGTAVFTLEHDPDHPPFQERGAPVRIEDRVFVGARALVLPGVTLGEGAVVGAGAGVTCAVAPFTVVACVRARPTGQQLRGLGYSLSYRNFSG